MALCKASHRRRPGASAASGPPGALILLQLLVCNATLGNEPENLVVELLRNIRAEVAGVRAELAAVKTEFKSEINLLRADVASDLVLMQAKNTVEHKITRDQVAGLRRAVFDYHASVAGHGVLISEFEDRLRRVEQHLNLPSQEAHWHKTVPLN